MSCCATAPGRAASPVDGDGQPVAATRPQALSWWRLIAGSALAGNMMLFSLAANLGAEQADTRFALHLGLLAATAVAMALLGEALGRRLLLLWRARRCDIEVLFATGIGGALLYSIYSTFVTGGPIYYEVVSILLALYGLSQRLKVTAQAQVERHLSQALLRETPAWVLQPDGQTKAMAARDVQPGMQVIVHPGQAIVVDGVVRRGTASVQTLALTGEPFGRAVGPGEPVYASWICLDATLCIDVAVAGDARQIDQIGALVVAGTERRDGLTHRPPSSTLALTERLTARFAPLVMAVAVTTFVGWRWMGDWETAWLHALAVLLVACPCALGFAVPLALRVGVLRLVGLGLSVRSLAAIERMARVKRVALDKTGTLTALEVTGDSLVRVTNEGNASAAVASPDDQSLLAIMQAAQRMVDHPIAAAFGRIRTQAPCPWRSVDAKLLPGIGIEAQMVDGDVHHRVQIGDPAKLAPEHSRLWVARLPPQSKAVALCIDDRLVAVVALEERDALSPKALFDSLGKRHLAVSVLSGDAPERLARLRAPAAEGGLQAQDKLARIQAWQRQGEPTCFVGDGFNDTAAMAFADASICVSNGTALAREVADITLPADQLALLPLVIDTCQQSMAAARTSIAFSLGYNTVGMGLAAAGFLNPVLASLLMLGSSLSVSACSARLWHQGEESRLSQRAMPTAATG